MEVEQEQAENNNEGGAQEPDLEIMEVSADAGGRSSNMEDDFLPYENWAMAVSGIDEPLPDSLVSVLAQVFGNDMLLENILEKIIAEDDKPTIRSCRLVSRQWLCALAKSYRKLKKPQFVVNTNKDSALLNDPRPRPFFEQHTLLFEFIKPMTRHDRIEGFVPTFSLKLGPSYFRKCNYTDFVNCIMQCGSSLVELYIKFPKNSAMSFLLPPGIKLPNLNTFGVSFSGQSLLGHHLPGLYHYQHDYFPNHCTIHLVQSILNASSNLRCLQFMSCANPVNPPDLENLYLPDSLSSVLIDTPLREFELLLKKNFRYLTELRLSATIALYSEESIFELFSKLSSTLRKVTLTGAPGTRRTLPIRLPRMENLTKFVIYKPWEFEERNPPTNFEEIFPCLQELFFANQTEYSFRYMMSGMRSTTLTTLTVWLTSMRAQQPILNLAGPHALLDQLPLLQNLQNVRPPQEVINRRERRMRQVQQRLQQLREHELRRRMQLAHGGGAAAGGAGEAAENREAGPGGPRLGPALREPIWGRPNVDQERRRFHQLEHELQQFRIHIEREMANVYYGNGNAGDRPVADAQPRVPQPIGHILRIGGPRVNPIVVRDIRRDIPQNPFLEEQDNVLFVDLEHHVEAAREQPDEIQGRARIIRLRADQDEPRIHVEMRVVPPPVADAGGVAQQGGDNPIGEQIEQDVEVDERPDLLIPLPVNDPAAPNQDRPNIIREEGNNNGIDGNDIINVINVVPAQPAAPQDQNEGGGDNQQQNQVDQPEINGEDGQIARVVVDEARNVRRARLARRARERLLLGLGNRPPFQIVPPVNLPDRPVTMNGEKMQSINLAFPNLSKLTINICGPLTCGLKYIFEEMTSLQTLCVIVVPSLWKIKWDSVLTGIPEDFCEAVKNSPELWDEVYLNENQMSIRRMAKLERLTLVECIKDDEQQQSVEESHLSDVVFHFALLKMRALKHLTVTPDFAPSKLMYQKWYDAKGYRIKTLPKRRLESSYYDL